MLLLSVLTGVLVPAGGLAQPLEPVTAERASDPLASAPAPPGYFLLAVPGGRAAYERLGFRPEERSHALVLLARALHGAVAANPAGNLANTVTEVLGPAGPGTPDTAHDRDGEAPLNLLAPFTERAWRQVLALDARADLFTALVRHRGALLVAAGGLEAGAGVREWLAGEPRLLKTLVYERPGAFAQAAPGLSRTGAGWRVPGDEAAWTALVGVAPGRPDEFLRRLLARDNGRLARFFATMASLHEPRRTALLQPVAGEDAATTLATLYGAASDAEAPWSPNEHPYQLSYADLPSVLQSLADVDVSRLPRAAGLWPALVTNGIDSREDAAAILQRERAAAPFPATVRALLRGTPRERREHIAMISIARRMWVDETPPDAQTDLLYAMGQFRRYRGLLLMLDRIGVTDPKILARVVDAARRIDSGGTQERTLRLTLVQGALALVERAALVEALSPAARDQVLRDLAEEVGGAAPAHRGIRAWLLDRFIPALPPLIQPDRFSGSTAYESRVLQALAGPPTDAAPPLSWEGLEYVVDTVGAEHQRILRIRSQIPSPGLDGALGDDDGTALAAAIRAMVYAVALGDPDGAVTLSPDVVDRHDLLGTRATGREFAWSPAVERTGSGAPWHVAGSLLGLDLALARSALRRLSADEMPPVPTINLNDELTLARTAVALRPQHFDAPTHAALAAAIARGRSRVQQAGTDAAALEALLDEVAVPASVRNGVRWTLASMPEAGHTFFSLRDVLWLGRPDIAADRLGQWGVLGEAIDGRLVTRMDAPVPWDRLAGRPDTGVLATQMPDLTLRLAELTAALGVPAALVPSLLLYATQDYWHEVEARFADDWPALVRGAASLRASRVEDYVAALASGGPLRPR